MRGNNKIKYILFSDIYYPFKIFASLTSTVPEFLNKFIIIANATAASAAARTITKTEIKCPSRWVDDINLLNAMKFKLAEFK